MKPDLEQRLSNALVRASDSGIGGSGLFAKTDFHVGELVCSYIGRAVSEEESLEMFRNNDPLRLYMMKCGDGSIVPEDITALGGHLANHSCNPNADFKPYPARPNTCVLHATRKIAAGEEITIYYAWVSAVEHPCRCGSRRCTGTIGLHLLTNDQDELGYADEDVVELLKVGYANRNKECRIPLQRLRTIGPVFDSDEAWTRQLDAWCTAAFGRNWKREPVFKWLFSTP